MQALYRKRLYMIALRHSQCDLWARLFALILFANCLEILALLDMQFEVLQKLFVRTKDAIEEILPLYLRQ